MLPKPRAEEKDENNLGFDGICVITTARQNGFCNAPS